MYYHVERSLVTGRSRFGTEFRHLRPSKEQLRHHQLTPIVRRCEPVYILYQQSSPSSERRSSSSSLASFPSLPCIYLIWESTHL